MQSPFVVVSVPVEASVVVPAPEIVELVPHSKVPLMVRVPALASVAVPSSSRLEAPTDGLPAVSTSPPLIRVVPAPPNEEPLSEKVPEANWITAPLAGLNWPVEVVVPLPPLSRIVPAPS